MKIVFENPDGTIGVIHPSPNWTGDMDELAKKDAPDNVWYVVVEDSDIPQDRTFREAWVMDWDNELPAVSMEKAREITKKRLRVERKPLLEALDIEYMIALEKGDNKKLKDIAGEKQKLRDITSSPEIEAAKSAEELKSIKVNSGTP